MKNFIKDCWQKFRGFRWTKENIRALSQGLWEKTVAFVKKYGNIQTWKDSMIPEHPEYNTRIKRFFIMFSGAVLLIVFVLVLLFLAVGTIQAPRVRVPSLVNMDVLDASRLIQAQNLQLAIDARFNEEAERNAVIGQYPSAGLIVRRGRRVTLMVSLGKDIYTAPDLGGLSKEEALSLLSQDNIPYQIVTVPAGESPTNVVIGQSVEGGSKVPRRRVLTLTVTEALLQDQYKMENFVRQSLEFAAIRLINNGLSLTIMGTNVSSSSDDGIIFDQTAAEGMLLAKGGAVGLTAGVYARDQGERNKLKWHILRYRIPAAPAPLQIITTNEAGEEKISAAEGEQAKLYRIELHDELGRRSSLYERRGGEGALIIRAFKAFGRSSLVISADGQELETRSYE